MEGCAPPLTPPVDALEYFSPYLLHGEMNHAKVVEYLPIKWCQVVGPLQAGDAGNKLLLTKEAHANVVPQLRGFSQFSIGGTAVFGLQKVWVWSFY